MATDKKFTVFGVSKHPELGYKVRFANDVMRIKNLAKSGHEDIRLCEVDSAMSKYEGIQKIQSMDEFQDAAAQSAISEYLQEKAPKTAKAKDPAVQAKAAPKVVETTELEDAPF